jgi:hypothetical protein
MSAGLSVAMGLGSASTAEAAGTAAGAGSGAGPAVPLPDVPLPDVPGMCGNRLANEFWYTFDRELSLAPCQELRDAYSEIASHVGGNSRYGLRDRWLTMSRKPEYPHNFISFVAPLAGPLKVVSAAQFSVLDRFYPNERGVVEAFAAFGQGVLYDPRRAEMKAEVHTMDDLMGYHTWHAYQRAMMFLGISRSRWECLAPVTGFAWAVQSVARPRQRAVNPPLPSRTLKTLARTWLPRGQRELDEAFQSTPTPCDLPTR